MYCRKIAFALKCRILQFLICSFFSDLYMEFIILIVKVREPTLTSIYCLLIRSDQGFVSSKLLFISTYTEIPHSLLTLYLFAAFVFLVLFRYSFSFGWNCYSLWCGSFCFGIVYFLRFSCLQLLQHSFPVCPLFCSFHSWMTLR